jgi:hypothetical protein
VPPAQRQPTALPLEPLAQGLAVDAAAFVDDAAGDAVPDVVTLKVAKADPNPSLLLPWSRTIGLR